MLEKCKLRLFCLLKTVGGGVVVGEGRGAKTKCRQDSKIFAVFSLLLSKTRELSIMGAVHFTFNYLVPSCVLIYTYIRIVWILKQRKLQIKSSHGQQITLLAQRRASRLLGAVIVAHNVCFLPYATLTFIASQPFICNVITEEYSYYAFKYLLLLSPSLNPVIYFAHSKMFRDACKGILMPRKKV